MKEQPESQLLAVLFISSCIVILSPLRAKNLPDGQQVTCANCDSGLEVVQLDPLELDWPMLDLDEEDDNGDEEEEEF